MKELIKTNNSKHSLQGLANSISEGDIHELAQRVSDFFTSVTDGMEPLNIDRFANLPAERLPEKYTISVEKTFEILSNVKPGKAQGPDKVPAWLLQMAAPSLAEPICSIFNASLQDQRVPAMWKAADVCPVPKVPNPTRIEKDLRPISLTPILSKCIEKIVRPWIMEFLEEVLDSTQYGSRQGLSTVDAMADLFHSWLLALEAPKSAIRILFLDFRKAFDLVDHNILMEKVVQLGLPDILIGWVASFLHGRQQRVKMSSSIQSEWSAVSAGVPQGTLLGPIAFLLHINSLQTSCRNVKYVDDTTVWESCASDGCDSRLQSAANEVVQWTRENHMQLNVDKTKEMVICMAKQGHCLPSLSLLDQPVGRVDTFKILGITVNNKLTWTDHIKNITKKAAKRLYLLCLLKRAGLSSVELQNIYTAMIRSVLEYGCEIWHPGLTKELGDELEHIQKRALRIAYPHLSYRESLSVSGLPDLRIRRENICRKFFQKVSHSSHILFKHLPKGKDCDYNLRRKKTFKLPAVKTERLKRSPIFYGVFNYQ